MRDGLDEKLEKWALNVIFDSISENSVSQLT